MPPLTMSDSMMRVVSKARDEAIRLNHAIISPDHLLLALIGTEENRVIQLLHTTGCDVGSLRSEVEHLAVEHNEAFDGKEFIPPFDISTISEDQIVQGKRPSGITDSTADQPDSRSVPLNDVAEFVMWGTMKRAVEYGRTQADTEHLLLSILDQPESVAASALNKCGVSTEKIEHLVEKLYRSE
jgi:ATP-dependent Clp protease ATP-binding subunit ClpA